MSTRLFASLAVTTLLLIGCDSPTGAGLDLAGGRSGEPITFSVPPSKFESGPVNDLTGAADRILAGSVNDPLVGSIQTLGYFDFQLGTSLTTDFADGPVTAVSLTLQQDYVYGDTTSASQLVITDVADSWLDTGGQSDTLLTAGSEIVQAELQPSDTTISIEMPAAWIAANDTTLRSVFFNTAFHGLQLSTVGEGFVSGFAINGSYLQIVSGGDTLVFGASQSLTNVSASAPASVPADRILIQDGSRIGVNMFVDKSTSDSLSRAVLSRAILKISADTLALQSEPPGFVRPTITALEFLGTTDSGLDVQIRSVEMNEEGLFVFESELYRDALQQQFRDSPVFESYSIRVPISENSVSSILIVAPGALEKEPVVDVTASLFE